MIKYIDKDGVVLWPELFKGILIRRYKRFMADIKLEDGQLITAHCPNSGSMKQCSTPGRTVYVSESLNPNRKLRYTWELIDMPTSLVGVNTMIPNLLVSAAIKSSLIPQLSGYDSLRTEVKYNDNSRIDILLEHKNNDNRQCFVEIKNCSMAEDKVAMFPDAATSRGIKHMKALAEQVHKGYRAVVFFLVQRMDSQIFRPADHIDPFYGDALRYAIKSGVEIIVYDVKITFKDIRLSVQLPYEL